MSVFVYSVCCSVCRWQLAKGISSVQGVLPTACRIKKMKKRPRSNKRTVKPQT
jgi:hypothetical protein